MTTTWGRKGVIPIPQPRERNLALLLADRGRKNSEQDSSPAAAGSE